MANSKDYILSLFPDNVNNEITAADLRIFVNSVFDEKIDKTDIQDNLVSTNREVPLSANQGRVLDEKISSLESILDTKEDNLGVGSYHQVLATGENGNKVWIDLPDIEQVYVYNKLDSVSTSLALSANQGRILSERISTNTSSINLLNTDLLDLTQRVTANEGLISSNTSNIADVQTSIDELVNNEIPNLKNKDTQLETSINSNATSISNLSSDLVGITQRVTNSENDIISLQNKDISLGSDISNLDSRVTANENNISNIQIQIGDVNSITLQSRVTVVEGNYDSLDSRITSNTDSISNLNSNITNIQTQVNNNSTNIFNNTNLISTNTSDISSLNSRTASLETDVASLKPRISTNEANISNLESQIIRLDAEDLDIRSDISTNRTLIDRNTTDIINNKQDIELLQTEQAEQNDKIQQNFVLTQNNLANVTYLLEQDSSILQSLSSLEMDVNGSPDGTIPGKENNLGAPSKDNMVLGSLKDGTRVWVDNALTEDIIKDVVDNLTAPTNNEEEEYKRTNSLSAYQGVVLDQKIDVKEDNLGLPSVDGMMLISSADGNRQWVEANELKVDFGYYFGAGATLLRINIVDTVGGVIDNRLENATRQLECYATYSVIDTEGTTSETTVNVTDDVDWISSDENAYVISDGLNGGLIRCITQNSTGSSYTDIPVRAVLSDGTNLVEASINISIDNTPVVKTIKVIPSEFTITGINNIYQLASEATYTHNNWNGSPTTITNTSEWSSNNTNVATVSTSGLVNSVNVGNAVITSSIDRYNGSIVSGSSLVTVTV